MASLPKSNTITYEEWLRTPEVSGAIVERDGYTEGILKPRHFPHVQIDIAEIWPD